MLKFAFKSIDNAPLIVFRIFFGFLIACESFGAIATGWVKKVLIEPQFTFSFIGLDWLQPLPGNQMYVYFCVMGILGLCIMIGYQYILTMTLYTVFWAGAYFMQKSAYNNHYYLLVLISFCMIFLPANKYASIDVNKKRVTEQKTMPYWVSLLFIIQIIIVYFYASIAKIYPDWLDGTFTKNLLESSTNNPFFRNLFTQKWFYLFIAYAGIVFDLLIVPLLLIRRTRTFALICSVVFHIFNAITLQIGIFPFFALTFILFFYEPDTIRKIFFKTKTESVNQKEDYTNSKIFKYIFIPFLIIQLILPIRHHFIKGDVLWTEEGHRLSWRMMLRERSGNISFKIINHKTKHEFYHNYMEDLTSKQSAQLPTKPDFIWQYCQKIKEKYKGENISIYIDCENSINRKPLKKFIDPNVDFAKAEWNYFSHNDWILPE